MPTPKTSNKLDIKQLDKLFKYINTLTLIGVKIYEISILVNEISLNTSNRLEFNKTSQHLQGSKNVV